MKHYVCDNCEKKIEDTDHSARIALVVTELLSADELDAKRVPMTSSFFPTARTHFCSDCVEIFKENNWKFHDPRRK